MSFFRKMWGGKSERGRETAALVKEAQEGITFEGKEPLDRESLETLAQAETDTRAFLESIGQHAAAKRIEGFAASKKAFFFTGLTVLSRNDEGHERIEAGGFFSWEFTSIAIHASVRDTEGQEGVYQVAVHELLHLASYLESPETLHAVARADGTKLRRQGGFDLMTDLPGYGYERDSSGRRFVSLNEGLTETMTNMVNPRGLNETGPYDTQRYLIQLLLRAIVATKIANGEAYTLKDAWKLISDDYFNNRFTFIQEVSSLFIKGALRDLALLEPLPPDDEPEKIKEMNEREEAVLERLAAHANMPFDRGQFSELRQGRRGSRLLISLKQMEDETMRVARGGAQERMAA